MRGPYDGHWQLTSVDTLLVAYDSLKLTQTVWDQEFNGYNKYCPLCTGSSYWRAPAGCVPVAGAQMLFYLHNKLGTPAFAPDTAMCIGHVGFGNYIQATGGSSSTTWNYMLDNDYNDKGYRSAAVLIADVGKKVGVTYGDDGSGASLSNLVSVFAQYGIDCTFSTFGTTSNFIIKQNLLAEMPVVMRAKPSANASVGHAFLIDGYSRSRYQYTFSYEWVYSHPSTTILFPIGERMTTVSYSTPEITEFSMNWGSLLVDNSAFFQINGEWNFNTYN